MVSIGENTSGYKFGIFANKETKIWDSEFFTWFLNLIFLYYQIHVMKNN